MKRILYISHTSELGGAERSLLLLLDNLDRARFAPAVLVPGEGDLTRELDLRDIPWRRIELPALKPNPSIWAIFKFGIALNRASKTISALMKEMDVGIVHSNTTTAHLFASKGANIAKLPSIWHVRDLSAPSFMEKSLAKSATVIVPISQAIANKLDTSASAKIHVIHNGVDTAAFVPGDGTLVRAELSIAPGAPVAGIVGQIVPWKGHTRFIEAAALVAERLPDARFIVAGDNRFGDFPNLLDELKSRADELGLADKMFFLGWREDICEVMNAIDVHCVASDFEPFGRVVIEAMACGKPVVAFNCGGPAEIIEQDATGVLVEPYAVDKFADAIAALLIDKELSARLGVAARAAVEQRFSAQTYAVRIQELYDSMLGGR